MNRILVFGMTENPGGVESFLINYYRHIDKNIIQFDFLCNSHEPIAYEDEIKSMGGRTFHITARSQNRKIYYRQLESVFSAHSSEWSTIWVNVSSLANIDYLVVAKKYGIKRRIIHSHNSRNMDGKLRGVLHFVNRRIISKYATDFWACSEDAARWFYNNKIINNAVIIHNAIDVEKIKFDSLKRSDIRKRYELDGKYVVGNIGRLHFQKNQEFIIDVFRKYHMINSESVLILVGQGEDEKKLKAKVKDIGLDNSVVFTGVQKDIQGLLSSFDLFLFPSKFEGLSIAVLEAQANGVPVLASKGVIPEEVKMNENFIFFKLSDGVEKWSKKIAEMKLADRADYASIKKNFIEHGYDIENEVNRLERLLVG